MLLNPFWKLCDSRIPFAAFLRSSPARVSPPCLAFLPRGGIKVGILIRISLAGSEASSFLWLLVFRSELFRLTDFS